MNFTKTRKTAREMETTLQVLKVAVIQANPAVLVVQAVQTPALPTKHWERTAPAIQRRGSKIPKIIRELNAVL